MPQDMNLSINGQSQVPPGFRFHPTEEELLHYYLRKKVAQVEIDLDVIREVDLNKLEPWDIQEKCRIGSAPQSDWYFFSHKDKKYPTGTRTNRATAAGFWKATGRDKIIYSAFRRIGLRKTLVFYKGRAPHGQKSDWIMHEYRLEETPSTEQSVLNPSVDQSSSEEGWVVCRIFRKKNFHKTLDHSPKSSSSTSMDSKLIHSLSPANSLSHNNIIRDSPSSVLDQILLHLGRNNTCKIGTDRARLPAAASPSDGCDTVSSIELMQPPPPDNLHDRFMHLPRLECPTALPLIFHTPLDELTDHHHHQDHSTQPLTAGDWASFDRLVASQLNGQAETPSSSAFGLQLADEDQEEEENGDRQQATLMSTLRANRSDHRTPEAYNADDTDDLWSFTKSSLPPPSDPLRHLSV